jgi:hypothetical protein
MGEQSQYQLQGEISARFLEAVDGFYQHELSHTGGIYEGRLPVFVS